MERVGGGDVRGWWGVEVVSFEIVRGLGASGQGESTVESFEMLEEALAEMSSAFPKPRITVITPRLAKSAAPQEYPRGMFTSAYMFVQVVDLRYRTSQKIPKKTLFGSLVRAHQHHHHLQRDDTICSHIRKL